MPRGGRSLIERVAAESRVPLFKHLDGICHTYLHAAADPEMARRIVLQRQDAPTGHLRCDRDAAGRPRGRGGTLLPLNPRRSGRRRLRGARRCGDAGDRRAGAAGDRRRTGTPSISTRSCRCGSSRGIDEAIDHIRKHSSQHTEAIVTEDAAAAETFLRSLDSAILMVNASTQFADGGEFGMGAEIGIATGKLHARGPVGVEQLTSFKYVVRGSGQCRP